MVNISTLKSEILDNILTKLLEPDGYPSFETELEMDDDGINLWDMDYNYFPNVALYRLLFVCKPWYKVVQRRLYRSIALGSDEPEFESHDDEDDSEGEEDYSEDEDDEDDEDNAYTERHDRLLRSLQRNPQLASLVHELRLGVMHDPTPATKAYGQILSLCTNVRSVGLHGWSYHHIQDIRDALRGTRQLEKLVVHAHSLGDIQCDKFMSFDELFYYMIVYWPNLKSVLMHNDAIGEELVDWCEWRKGNGEQDDEKDEEEIEDEADGDDEDKDWEDEDEEREIPPWPFADPIKEHKLPNREVLKAIITSPPNSVCPQLREFTLREGWRPYTVHLRALSRIAPNMKTLRMAISNGTASTQEQFEEALKSWAHSLEDVIIRSAGGFGAINDAAFFRQFTALRSLRTTSALIKCSALVDAPKLERLEYILSEGDQDLRELIHALPDFKQLKRIYVRPPDYGGQKPSSHLLDGLELLCQVRGVNFRSHWSSRF